MGKIGLEEEITALNEQRVKARERLIDTQNKFATGQMISHQTGIAKLFYASIDDLKAAEGEFLESLVRSKEVEEKILQTAEQEFKNKKITADELQRIYQTFIDVEGSKLKQDELKERLHSLVQRQKGISSPQEVTPEDAFIDHKSNPEKLPVIDPKSLLGGGLGPQKFSRVPGGGTTMEDVAKSIDVTFTDLLRTSGVFQESFNAGMQAVGQGMHQSFSGKYCLGF